MKKEKKGLKKLAAFGVAAALMFTTVPYTAQAQVTYQKSQVLYQTSLEADAVTNSGIEITCTQSSELIRKSSVKSSKMSVAEPLSVLRETKDREEEYFDGRNSQAGTSYRCYIGLSLKKAGKTDISFKAGSKTYHTSVTVKKYQNPVKSLTVTGVDGGKNIADSFRTDAYAGTLKLSKKNVKNAAVKVTPKKGWRIQYLETYDIASGTSHTVSNYGKKGVKNAALQLENLSGSTMIGMEFVDSKGASIYCSCFISDKQ